MSRHRNVRNLDIDGRRLAWFEVIPLLLLTKFILIYYTDVLAEDDYSEEEYDQAAGGGKKQNAIMGARLFTIWHWRIDIS